MDEVRCIDPETVAEVLELPAEHPVRLHAQRCPRCQSLLEGYRLFLAPPDVAPEHAWPTAEPRLDALREELTGVTSASSATTSLPSEPGRAKPDGSWWARLFQPSLRPAWAFATAAVVVAFVLVLPQLQSRRPGSTLRGSSPGTNMTLAEPTFDTDGAVHLSWAARSGATGYRVVFYSTKLEEIARRDAGSATSVMLTPGDLPEPYRLGEVVLYRVQALEGGDAVATSEVGTLRRR